MANKTDTFRAEALYLLNEAREAMLNLVPYVRNEMHGCFNDLQDDCPCTSCKIKRFLERK